MNTNRTRTPIFLPALLATMLGAGCSDDPQAGPGGSTGEGSTGSTTQDDDDSDTGEKLDVGNDSGSMPVGCNGDSDCELIDVLFVIDNSGTMGEEQLNLAANFPRLIERLTNLENSGGESVNADVNIMVTTSDFGHPLCTSFQSEDYRPAKGSPVYTGCNSRMSSFSNTDPFNPMSIPEACTEACPEDIAPGGDTFIHFDGQGSNVAMGDVSGALSCVAPQGINGCGYEAPLESMLQALRPEACWNDPEAEGCDEDPTWGWVGRGFIRPGSTLAIAIITDESDCSVRGPEGYSWFTDTDNDEYWLDNPNTEGPLPSSAICWQAGTNCQDEDGDGVFESCEVDDDNPVLHPTTRYKEFLSYLQAELSVEVVMLGVLGIPPVTAHAPTAPFEPTEGGVADLQYRNWRDGEYDGTDQGGDILPSDWASGLTADHKQWEFGVGPGCTGTDAEGNFTGQAMPPVRIREVCESLNEEAIDGSTKVRCCMESICDDDFSVAMDCLTGIIQEVINPVG
ncbi:MAG: VWA domain-containing protein [Deltaproteobacteria bacterium]|nr:VWA domain-containing protein [Deltaproteobacteria bacterium]